MSLFVSKALINFIFIIYKEFSSIVKYFKLNQSSALMDELLDNRQ